jgi:hypothetical protein
MLWRIVRKAISDLPDVEALRQSTSGIGLAIFLYELKAACSFRFISRRPQGAYWLRPWQLLRNFLSGYSDAGGPI